MPRAKDSAAYAEISPLELNPRHTLRRIPPRPAEQRQAEYESEFEDVVVFYDCFASADGADLVCIGPPLANLKREVLPPVFRGFQKRILSRSILRDFDRHAQLWFRAGRVEAGFETGRFAQQLLRAQPNGTPLFENRRAIVTISKDNEIIWIRDWVDFYVRYHGCDAVLIYDTGSTKYGRDELQSVISAVPGIAQALVVRWPYKWGPSWGTPPLRYWQGPNGIQHDFWDSDFLQYATLEHARHRFLLKASAVINADIDELVFTENGESAFELALRSKTGFLSYGGIWIENASTQAALPRSYRDYIHNRIPPRPASAKWTIVPSRCPVHLPWATHWILDMQADELSARVLYRHYKGISTNWKNIRRVDERPSGEHVVDAQVAAWFEDAGQR
jgi:hypothetical protein